MRPASHPQVFHLTLHSAVSTQQIELAQHLAADLEQIAGAPAGQVQGRVGATAQTGSHHRLIHWRWSGIVGRDGRVWRGRHAGRLRPIRHLRRLWRRSTPVIGMHRSRRLGRSWRRIAMARGMRIELRCRRRG